MKLLKIVKIKEAIWFDYLLTSFSQFDPDLIFFSRQMIFAKIIKLYEQIYDK